MMLQELLKALSAAGQRLMTLAAQDAELVGELRGLAERFLRATEPPPPPAAEAAAGAEEAAAPSTPPPEPAEPVVLPPIELQPAFRPSSQHVALPHAPGIEVPAGVWQRMGVSDAELPVIEQRCRLKAEGTRWAVARQRRIQEGADYYTEIETRDREVISKAKALPDCFLWMNHPTGPCPNDGGQWEDLAGCFETMALVVGLLREVIGDLENNRSLCERALDLAAEAQSALRMAVSAVGGNADNDQEKLFRWLRNVAAEQQVYIERHMRIGDPADPRAWADLQERISRLDAEIDAVRNQKKQRRKLVGKGQYHARLLREGKGGPDDWQKVLGVIETLVTEGVPPSNAELREMLLPIVDEMPDQMEAPPGVQRVMTELDRYLATQVAPAAETVREPSEAVRRVALLYEGKTLVLVGGDRRPHAYEALKSAFRLQELTWIATRAHESTEIFDPYLARPEVAAVLLAIRWSSHSYGELRTLCEQHGKEFFRLPGGYNPNQVAHQILQQRGAGSNGGARSEKEEVRS